MLAGKICVVVHLSKFSFHYIIAIFLGWDIVTSVLMKSFCKVYIPIYVNISEAVANETAPIIYL